tara:strand:+ start:616 stop:1350 length:735 start_codon:yes stop_codon:yes gene_type:complete
MANLSSNSKFWKAVSKTDPKYTKDGQQGMSSIDGYYMFQKATEAFGMCGIGWGYEVIEEDYRTGGPIYDKGKTEVIAHEIDHMLRVKFWYMQGETKGELTHYGITRYVYSSKYGPITDEEAPKKSLTDAIKKCLSMLGFCADVYMGKFEDDAYVAGAAKRAEIERQDEQDKELEAALEELDEWLANEMDSASKIKEISPYKAAMTAIWRKLKTRGDALGVSVKERQERITEKVKEREGQQQEAA